MTQHIRERISRKLETLNEERLYQVLDYVEFLESKYAARQSPAPNTFQKFAEGIEDRLRAGRVSASTIAETMGLLNRAVGVLNGVAAAGKSVAADLANAAQRVDPRQAARRRGDRLHRRADRPHSGLPAVHRRGGRRLPARDGAAAARLEQWPPRAARSLDRSALGAERPESAARAAGCGVLP